FVMGANYHGGAEVMNYPWDNTYTLHADDAWWQLVSHEYANLCHAVSPSYMTDYNNGITNGAQWYMIGGGRQDYMNGYAQCREVTIECSNTKLPSGSQMPNFWNINKNAIFAYVNQCLYGIHGTVTDAANGEPLEATITITGHDDEYSVVKSHQPAGDFHRPIKGGTYTLTFSANGYHPHQETVTIADGETVTLNVQLEAGEGLLPDFTASATSIALGGTVSFTDETWGANLVSWQWTFEGGTPSSSTAHHPSGIVYNNMGDFDVTLTVSNASGQTETVTKRNYIHVSEAYNMENATVTTCNALFYDNGGPGNNYSHNCNYTMTFQPGNPDGIIEAVFESFQTENNYDFLYIYNGASTSASLIGTYSGNNSPGTVTANNNDGALTFRFTSDQSVNGAGWSAVIHCLGLPDPLEVTATADPQVINEGEHSQLHAAASGGEGDYRYEWEPSEYLDDPYSADPVATPVLATTEFSVTVTDEGGNSARAYVTVEIRDVQVGEHRLDRVTVFPNPSEGLFSVRGIQGPTRYQLTNALGQTVTSGHADSDFLLDRQLAPGVYLLRLSDDTAATTLKITVK
ncbi:MAG: carboxypeptidase regulatory-like domain-containing protein, partial [Bacteroidales bacterium]|nr:carboxypeptidase regulatory-like domain-containing protein [Bacteroidales bacterium]